MGCGAGKLCKLVRTVLSKAGRQSLSVVALLLVSKQLAELANLLWCVIETTLDMQIRIKLLQRTLGGGGNRGLL